MTNRHAGRNGVRVDDQVRTDAFLSERHVLLTIRHTDGTLLSVPGRKLVSNLRNPDRSHLDLGEAISVFVRCQNDLVNHSFLRVLQLDGAVFARLEDVSRLSTSVSSKLLTILKHVLDVPDCSTFADDDIVTINNRSWVDDSIIVQLIVGAVPHILSLPEVRSLKDLILLLRLRVGAEEG